MLISVVAIIQLACFNHPIINRIEVGFYSFLYISISVSRYDPVVCSPPGSSEFHGILQARILEWVAIPFSLYGLIESLSQETQERAVSMTLAPEGGNKS